MSNESRGKSGPALVSFSLLGILAVGTVLRFWRLSQNSLWTDEIASLKTAQEPFWTIPRAALNQDAFEPPLYFWLLHLISAAFGDGETALRFVSVIAGALTIPLVWVLVWELSQDKRAAMLAATFLALNPLHLWYSQEARPYALMICFGTAALAALARTLRQPSLGLWVTFVLCSSLAMLSHAVGVLVPIVAFVWVILRADRARTLRPTLVALGANLLLVAPSYLMLANAIIHAGGTGSPERPLTGLELPYTALAYLGGYSFGPSVREIQDIGWRAAASHHMIQLGLAAIFLCVWLALAVMRRSAMMTGLLVLCILPAILALVGSAATAKAYNVRYTVIGIIGFVATLSAAIGPLRPALRNAAVTAFLLIFIWADVQWFLAPRYRKDDARAAVAWLRTRVPPDATVAVAPAYAVGALAHYAEKSGARLCLVGVAGEGDLSRNSVPDALVLTRLYHIDDWQGLETEYGRVTGSALERGSEIGFRLFARSPRAEHASARLVACDDSTVAASAP